MERCFRHVPGNAVVAAYVFHVFVHGGRFGFTTASGMLDCQIGKMCPSQMLEAAGIRRLRLEVTHSEGPARGVSWFYSARGAGLWYSYWKGFGRQQYRGFFLVLELVSQTASHKITMTCRHCKHTMDKEKLLAFAIEVMEYDAVITLMHQDPGAFIYKTEVISFPRGKLMNHVGCPRWLGVSTVLVGNVDAVPICVW